VLPFQKVNVLCDRYNCLLLSLSRLAKRRIDPGKKKRVWYEKIWVEKTENYGFFSTNLVRTGVGDGSEVCMSAGCRKFWDWSNRGGGSEKSRLCSVLTLKSVGFSLAESSK